MPAEPSGMKKNDYARGAVSEENTSTGLHLALIIVGGAIGFAIYVVAAQIGGSLGYVGSAAAFSLGSLILGVMGAVTSYVGARSRLSTYLLTEFAFGKTGAKIANTVIAISLVGWYAVISNTLGVAAQQMLAESIGVTLSPYLTVTLASLFMIAVTAMGFTGIDKLALYLVPFMVLFMVIAAGKALAASSGEAFEATREFTFQTAVSAVIGAYIAGVIVQPDYSRFAVNTRHAVWSVFIALGVLFPLIQYLSAIPSMALGEPDVVKAMALLGFLAPGFVLMFLGAWGSNVLCLYSAGLSIATLIERVRLHHIVIAVGVVGTAVAFVPAQAYLVEYLVILGVTIPPIGAVYVIDSMVIRKFNMDLSALDAEPSVRWSGLAAWLFGAAAGYASDKTAFQIVDIAALDSLIAASILFVILEYRKSFSKKRPVRIQD